MNEKVKHAIFKMQQLASELTVQVEDLRITIVRDELRRQGKLMHTEFTQGEQEIYNLWYRFYTTELNQPLLHHDADMRARRRVEINRKYNT